jgi:outer membrane cobalamin receptor
MNRPAGILALPLALLLAQACASNPQARPPRPASSGDEILITDAMIANSGVATAWEAIKRHAPQIQYRERSNGEPTRIWRRGRTSYTLNDAPLVFLDGVRVPDYRALDYIPAGTVSLIRILTGINGTTYYGTNAVNGVILVHTRQRL